MNDFIKNPQTRNARTFWPLNISAVGSVTTVERGMVWLVGWQKKLFGIWGIFSSTFRGIYFRYVGLGYDFDHK